ncbi:MAG: hypothetical protein ABUK11_09275 [Mariprofundaceae bacterium]
MQKTKKIVRIKQRDKYGHYSNLGLAGYVVIALLCMAIAATISL